MPGLGGHWRYPIHTIPFSVGSGPTSIYVQVHNGALSALPEVCWCNDEKRAQCVSFEVAISCMYFILLVFISYTYKANHTSHSILNTLDIVQSFSTLSEGFSTGWLHWRTQEAYPTKRPVAPTDRSSDRSWWDARLYKDKCFILASSSPWRRLEYSDRNIGKTNLSFTHWNQRTKPFLQHIRIYWQRNVSMIDIICWKICRDVQMQWCRWQGRQHKESDRQLQSCHSPVHSLWATWIVLCQIWLEEESWYQKDTPHCFWHHAIEYCYHRGLVCHLGQLFWSWWGWSGTVSPLWSSCWSWSKFVWCVTSSSPSTNELMV